MEIVFFCAVACLDNLDVSTEHVSQIIECVMGGFIVLMGQMRLRKFVRSMSAERINSAASMADVYRWTKCKNYLQFDALKKLMTNVGCFLPYWRKGTGLIILVLILQLWWVEKLCWWIWWGCGDLLENKGQIGQRCCQCWGRYGQKKSRKFWSTAYCWETRTEFKNATTDCWQQSKDGDNNWGISEGRPIRCWLWLWSGYGQHFERMHTSRNSRQYWGILSFMQVCT